MAYHNQHISGSLRVEPAADAFVAARQTAGIAAQKARMFSEMLVGAANGESRAIVGRQSDNLVGACLAAAGAFAEQSQSLCDLAASLQLARRR